jgi:transposase InsO family protein
MAITVIQPTWIDSVLNSYLQDEHCQELLQRLAVTPDTTGTFTLTAGILRYKSRIYIGADKDLQNQLLGSFHASAIGGHSGMVATYQRIKRLFYWPGLKKDTQHYIIECAVCQRAKAEHCPYPGLLEPLERPDMAWQHITMDFIEAMPKSNGKEVILVVVDRLTKLAHFIPLSHPYSVQTVAQAFVDNIFKLHGPPSSIVTDRDRIFTSNMWQSVFKSLKVKLKLSTAYHPQTDGQSERVNQCLESYLRCMAFQEPKKWASWLALAEWWYNTSYHTALKMSPFQALYVFPPPMINELALPGPEETEARDFIAEKQNMLTKLKENLAQAQARMKKHADKKRTERVLQLGDMVYLKMQPYRRAAFGLRQSIKLTSKYYGPFRVLEKIGSLSYKILLPEGVKIHPVFHVSQLKKHLGKNAVPQQGIPLVTPDGKIKTEPTKVLETRSLPRNGVLVTQWLIEWANLTPQDSSWEDANFIKKVFPHFYSRTIKTWFPNTT